MAEYLGRCWKCICGKIDNKKPWACPDCGKEVCEYCFDYFMHCKECSAKQIDKDKLRVKAEQVYMVVFTEYDLIPN